MSVGKIAALAASAALWTIAQPAAASIVIEQLAAPDPGHTRQLTTITGNTHVAGDTRLFMTSRTGLISYYDQATSSYADYNNLAGHMGTLNAGEHGLLGLTFDPGYATNGQYYAYLTQTNSPTSVSAQVLRLTDPTIAGAVVADQLIWSMDLGNTLFHIAGWIDFDKTGNLLIAVGEGGTYLEADQRNTGQDPSDWWGSILRINPYGDDFAGDDTRNYSIPTGPNANPAIMSDQGVVGAPEIFAYGVRNPFRNTVTPDGDLIIADVGFEQREELTILEADSPDRNLGWSLREGGIQTPGPRGGAEPSDYQAPDLVYDHSEGAAIIGGFVYQGTLVPELVGKYVFADQVSGRIWAISFVNGAFVGTKEQIGVISSLVSFGETADHELVATQYVAGGQGAAIYRFTSDRAPGAVPEPASWAMLIAGFGMAGGAMRRRPVLQFQAARRLV